MHDSPWQHFQFLQQRRKANRTRAGLLAHQGQACNAGAKEHQQRVLGILAQSSHEAQPKRLLPKSYSGELCHYWLWLALHRKDSQKWRLVLPEITERQFGILGRDFFQGQSEESRNVLFTRTPGHTDFISQMCISFLSSKVTKTCEHLLTFQQAHARLTESKLCSQASWTLAVQITLILN